MKRLVCMTLSLSLISATGAAETQEFDLAGITQVEVDNTSGEVNITGITSGKAAVTADKKEFGDNCRLTIEKKDKTLQAKVKKTGLTGNCKVDFTIKAPRTAKIDVELGNGRLRVKETSGELDYKIGFGAVDVDAEVKELEGKSGSGDVTIKGLTGNAEVEAGTGKIHLTYVSLPATGKLKIKTGSGDAEVVVPKEAKIQTDFAAGFGKLTDEVGSTPGSGFKVSMKAGSGDLHLRKQ